MTGYLIAACVAAFLSLIAGIIIGREQSKQLPPSPPRSEPPKIGTWKTAAGIWLGEPPTPEAEPYVFPEPHCSRWEQSKTRPGFLVKRNRKGEVVSSVDLRPIIKKVLSQYGGRK